MICFVAPVANSPRRDALKSLISVCTIKNLKNFVTSLYRFYQYTLNFKHDAKFVFMFCFVADEICVLIGSVKSLSVENFQSFYSMTTYIPILSTRSVVLPKRTFLRA